MICPICHKELETGIICPKHYPIATDGRGNIIYYTVDVQNDGDKPTRKMIRFEG